MPIECAPAPTTNRPLLYPGSASAASGFETIVSHAKSTATRVVVPSDVAPSETVKRSPRQKASVTVTRAAPELVNVNGLPVAVDPAGPKKNGCQDPTAIGVAPALVAATPAMTIAQASTRDFRKTVVRMILSSSIRAARQARVRNVPSRVTLSALAADLPLVQIAALPDPELVKGCKASSL